MDNVPFMRTAYVINGKVATVDAHFIFKRAIAVKQGWIINVGEDREDSAAYWSPRPVIDLGGKLIYPPRMTHISISARLADSWHCLNCQDVRSWQYCGKDCATRQPPLAGAWIRVCGSGSKRNQGVPAEQRLSTRWDIDDVTADHPTLLALCGTVTPASSTAGRWPSPVLTPAPLIPSADIWGERPVANWTAISSTCPPSHLASGTMPV